jgi:hypothetical protein
MVLPKLCRAEGPETTSAWPGGQKAETYVTEHERRTTETGAAA